MQAAVAALVVLEDALVPGTQVLRKDGTLNAVKIGCPGQHTSTIHDDLQSNSGMRQLTRRKGVLTLCTVYVVGGASEGEILARGPPLQLSTTGPPDQRVKRGATAAGHSRDDSAAQAAGRQHGAVRAAQAG